jgi:hypothetical protein
MEGRRSRKTGGERKRIIFETNSIKSYISFVKSG